MSIEDLETVTAFWESKYLQERIGLSKAMSTIKTLGLWDVMLHEGDEAIENLDNERINAALKKDLAITYLCREDSEITGKMKKQYKKFIKEQNLQENELSDEVDSFLPEISNLEAAASDVSILECLIIYQLMNKEMKIKRWGIVENKPENSIDIENYDGVTIAIENRNFRGPLIMGVSNELLKDFTDKGIKVPKYEKELNEAYCDVMSNLYLPTNNFFNNLVKRAYNENPESKLLADLAGKKVRSGEER